MKFSKNVNVIIICFSLVAATASVQADEDKKIGEQTTEHKHDKEHTDTGMVLNEGKKWETDMPLRKGMQSIHDVVKNAEKAFQSKTLTQEQGKELGSKINKQLMYMVENCELAPKADASLHVVIGEMMQGIGELSKAPNSEGGFPRIHKALKQYPKFFDHPELN
jgi:hypothetical protein